MRCAEKRERFLCFCDVFSLRFFSFFFFSAEMDLGQSLELFVGILVIVEKLLIVNCCAIRSC